MFCREPLETLNLSLNMLVCGGGRSKSVIHRFVWTENHHYLNEVASLTTYLSKTLTTQAHKQPTIPEFPKSKIGIPSIKPSSLKQATWFLSGLYILSFRHSTLPKNPVPLKMAYLEDLYVHPR